MACKLDRMKKPSGTGKGKPSGSDDMSFRDVKRALERDGLEVSFENRGGKGKGTTIIIEKNGAEVRFVLPGGAITIGMMQISKLKKDLERKIVEAAQAEADVHTHARRGEQPRGRRTMPSPRLGA